MSPISRLIPPEQLASYSSEIQGLDEQRRWSFYDRQVYAAAATVSGDVTLFSTPIGQGSTAKTLLDTNMRQAGQLPARQAFIAYDIRVQPQLTVISEDATIAAANNIPDAFWSLIYGGSFTFRQAQKVDLELAPLAMLPAGYGAAGPIYGGGMASASTSGGAFLGSNGSPNRTALWDLDPLPIVILPQRSFSVVLNFPTAIVLPTGVGLNLWVHLDGVLLRSA